LEKDEEKGEKLPHLGIRKLHPQSLEYLPIIYECLQSQKQITEQTQFKTQAKEGLNTISIFDILVQAKSALN
jgi:hypothetical protein